MRRFFIFLTCLLLLSSAISYSQTCGCPSLTECKPCSGGYTSLTLRYNGSTTALVLAKDGVKILAELTLSPREEFTISGSKKNEKFAEKLVPFFVNGISDTMLGAMCSDLTVGETYGSFTVIAAMSTNGSIVCCTTPLPDVVAPQILNIPNTINAKVKRSCVSSVSWIEPIASDNCQLQSLTSSHKPGDVFAIGTTQVTYIATDQSGLTTSASFYVIVSDQTAPVFDTTFIQDIVVPADDLCSANVTWTEPEVTDECSFTLTKSHKPNDRFNLGTTKVEYQAKDLAGNISTFSFNVIVEDKTAPFFDSFPEDISATVQSQCGARVSWPLPSISDRCSPVIVTSTHQPNQEFALGVTKVRYTANDNSGNEVIKEMTITVSDERKLEVVNCPKNIDLTVEEGNSAIVSWLKPSVTNSCEEISLASNHDPGESLYIGTRQVEYVASTPSGKKAYCRFDVRIAPAEKPLHIAKLISPDGDSFNDEWILTNISDYRDNKVQIFDRWGGVIFEAVRYDNETVVWKGTNRSGGLVPTGTYFYLIVANNGKRKIQESGSVELVR